MTAQIRHAQSKLTLLTTLALYACGGDAGTGRALRSDSAGVEIVRNTGVDQELPWTFEKVLDLGGEVSGGLEFHRVHNTSVATDSAGLIYVLDAGNYRITVLDRAGQVVRTMGGQGRGPGEMSFPTDMAVGDDGMAAVWDFNVGGFLRYAPDGTPLSDVKVTGALQRELAVMPGRIAGVFTMYDTETVDSVQTRLWAIGETDTLVLAVRNEPTPRVATFDCMALSLPPYLSPGIAWAARGDRIVARTTAEYVIDVHAGGRQVASWRRDIPTVSATIEHAIAEAPADSFRMVGGAGRCAVSNREAIEQIGYAPLVPLVQDLHSARDGMTWVRRRTGVPGEFRIDLLDANGEYAGTLPAVAPWPAAFRGTDEIVTVERDDLDLPHVVVYRINRAVS
jgi:hypothetical protein